MEEKFALLGVSSTLLVYDEGSETDASCQKQLILTDDEDLKHITINQILSGLRDGFSPHVLSSKVSGSRRERGHLYVLPLLDHVKCKTRVQAAEQLTAQK